MVTHLPIDIIAQATRRNGGISAFEVASALYILGYAADRELTKYNGLPLPELCIINVRHHWALHWRGEIWCSCLGIIPIKEYKGRIKYYLKIEVPNG